MKRQLFAFACATLFGCSIASAADLAIRKAPLAPAPVSSWTGLYIGAHVGTGWGTTEAEFISQTQSNGFLGGVQGGYNLQLSPAVVIGVEGDVSFTGIKGTSPCIFVFSCSTEHDWIATLAGRFGVTYDRALFYVKGGVAWAQTTYSASLFGTTITTVDETRLGALFGTGIEYAFLPGWSAKFEYNYIDFGKDDFSFPVGAGSVNVAVQETTHLVKAGLNYKIGGGY